MEKQRPFVFHGVMFRSTKYGSPARLHGAEAADFVGRCGLSFRRICLERYYRAKGKFAARPVISSFSSTTFPARADSRSRSRLTVFPAEISRRRGALLIHADSQCQLKCSDVNKTGTEIRGGRKNI